MPPKIVFFALLFLLVSCTPSLKIEQMMVDDYAEDMPLIDSSKPLFGWQLSGEKNGAAQSAYQLKVARTKDELEEDELLWDSGKQLSGRSLAVRYEGPDLLSAQNYFWQLRVWDEDDRATAWTAPRGFLTGLWGAEKWQGAKWIAYEQLPDSLRVTEGKNGYGNDSKDVVEERAIVPLFRKEFRLYKRIESATLYITGLGHYEASINGEPLTEAIFTPSWSNYDSTIYYNAYDVKSFLQRGNNAIGVVVGTGFQYINRERYRKLLIAYAFPRLKCVLKLRYTNGEEEHIVSNESWKTRQSPITFTSIYGGEDYDARLELRAWDKPYFNDRSWEKVVLPDTPAGDLKADINHPIRVMERFEPDWEMPLDDSTMLYDFGQNASAKIAARLQGETDDVVRFYPAEILHQNRITQKGSGSPYYYECTLADEDAKDFETKFSYYGFRYVEARGVDAKGNRPDLPRVLRVESQHVRNSAAQLGNFHSSNELFNQIYSLINWAIKSNYQSVMTDCPTREKLGWLEQTQLMGPSVHYNFQVHQIYKKLLEDMSDAQTPAGLIPSIVPEYINFGYYDEAYSDSPEWGSAVILLPYFLNKWYADEEPMRKHWSMMNRYMDYLSSKSEHYLLHHGLGDWYDIGPNAPGYAQLTSVPLVASATYYRDAEVMKEMAQLIGDQEKQQHYAALQDSIKANFNARFYRDSTASYENGSQTALALPLALGMVEPSNEKRVLQNLLQSIEVAGDVHTTGEVGFPRLLDALTAHGHADLIYQMNNRTDVPGYGYQIKKGATALTESWQALAQPSQNHFMIGHLMGWLYSGLAGIGQQAHSVGYRHALIEPRVVEGLSEVEASFQTPYGELVSSYKNTPESFELTVKVPVNTDALVVLPFKGKPEIEGIKHNERDENPINGSYAVPSGIYRFYLKKTNLSK